MIGKASDRFTVSAVVLKKAEGILGVIILNIYTIIRYHIK
jgi:hypothetical protein